jgi:hypothetical protein
VLHEFAGGEFQMHLGIGVAGIGDVDGANGYARIYSGADGDVVHAFHGDGPGTSEEFGVSVAGAGDVNGDGVPDVIVGSRQDMIAGFLQGAAWVYSGADGSVIHVLAGSPDTAQFGSAVAWPGDLDGDGLADVLAWTAYDPPGLPTTGMALAYSGADGSLLFGVENAGAILAAVGDVDGDGPPDFAHPTAQATTLVRSGHKLLVPDLGNALAGTFGPPSLVVESSLHRKTPFVLSISGAAHSTPVLLVLGGRQALLPFKGGVLVPSPDLVLASGLVTDASGAMTVQATITWVLPTGTTIYLQAWLPDPGGPNGFAATNAVVMVAP